MPHRIQLSLLSQVAASTAPVVVAEPSRRMVPRDISLGARPEHVLDRFREWLTTSSHPATAAMREALSQLPGKDLACRCALATPCHGDVLLELANPD